jgi:hypothetical protein
MAEASRFWTTTGTGDGPAGGYTAAQFAEFVRQTLMTDTLTEGVLKGIGNELAVTSASGSVNVATGAGLVYGAFYANDATVNIVVENTAASARIDRIVLRANFSPTTGDLPQTIRIKKSDGVAGTGVPPALVQSSTGIFEIPLATVNVSAGGGTITVTDARTFVKTPGTYGYLDDSNIINAAQIVASAVTEAKIGTGAVTADKIGTSAVIEAKIGTGAVTADKIGTSAVIEAKIGTGAVTSGKIGANAVVSGKIAADAVTTAAILNGTVTSDKLVSSAVIESKIATGAVTVDKIGAGAVISSKIATTSVTGGTTGNIALTTITADNLASNAVTADKIISSAVTTVKIANDAVTSAKIGQNEVFGGTLGNIALTTITADNIVAGTITGAKIAGTTITSANIAADAVTSAKIADGAVVTDSIANLAITSAKMGSASVGAGSIMTDAVTGVKIGEYAIKFGGRQGGDASNWLNPGTTRYDDPISTSAGGNEVAMAAGSISISISGSSSGTASVTFYDKDAPSSAMYSSNPILIATPNGSTDYIIDVSSISTSGATIRATHKAGTSATTTVTVWWISMGTTTL